MTFDDSADIKAIDKLYDQYVQAANTSDLELFMAVWDDNAIRLEPDHPSIIGKENIRTHFKASFSQFIGEIKIYGDTEIRPSADWAFAHGTFTLLLIPRAGGTKIFIDGKWMDILKRQSDGSWKLFRDMVNYNAPPREQ